MNLSLQHLFILAEEASKHLDDCTCPVCPHIEAAIIESLSGGGTE